MAQTIKSALLFHADQKKKSGELACFFRAFPGGYGEGDTFLGVKVPDQRVIAKIYYRNITGLNTNPVSTNYPFATQSGNKNLLV